MRVRVTGVDPRDPALLRVQADGLDSWGLWRGAESPPLEGAEVDIELTVEDDCDCRWHGDNDLVGISSGPAGYLSGRVEEAEADCVVTMRVGDGIMLVEVPGDGRLPQVGERLTISDVHLTLWPT